MSHHPTRHDSAGITCGNCRGRYATAAAYRNHECVADLIDLDTPTRRRRTAAADLRYTAGLGHPVRLTPTEAHRLADLLDQSGGAA